MQRETAARDIVTALELPPPRALVLLNGGTAELPAALEAQLRSLLADGLARLAAEDGITLLTGGTEAGIFALLGQGIAKWKLPVQCIGVVPSGPIRWPGASSGEASLEPHHSHFVAVAGEAWGDETATMYALAAAFACPSLAVFAGGGKITLREMEANVTQQRAMLLIAGSGRKADAVLAARGGAETGDTAVRQIARDGRIVPFPLEGSAEQFRETIKRHLWPAPPPALR